MPRVPATFLEGGQVGEALLAEHGFSALVSVPQERSGASDTVRRGDHARRLVFQLAESAVPRALFQGVLDSIGRLCPTPG